MYVPIITLLILYQGNICVWAKKKLHQVLRDALCGQKVSSQDADFINANGAGMQAMAALFTTYS